MLTNSFKIIARVSYLRDLHQSNGKRFFSLELEQKLENRKVYTTNYSITVKSNQKKNKVVENLKTSDFAEFTLMVLPKTINLRDGTSRQSADFYLLDFRKLEPCSKIRELYKKD